MNQAHLSVGERKYELAINLYKNVLEKFLPNDLNTEMYLAKVYYRKGDFETSKRITLRLITRHPHNLWLKYNLALCLFSQAHKIIHQQVRRSQQTREAIEYLKHAQKIFAWLANERNHSRFIKKSEQSADEASAHSLEDLLAEIRQTAEKKNYDIAVFIEHAREELAKDEAAEVKRTEKERQRFEEEERIRI